jgi:hypothetical protein
MCLASTNTHDSVINLCRFRELVNFMVKKGPCPQGFFPNDIGDPSSSGYLFECSAGEKNTKVVRSSVIS